MFPFSTNSQKQKFVSNLTQTSTPQMSYKPSLVPPGPMSKKPVASSPIVSSSPSATSSVKPSPAKTEYINNLTQSPQNNLSGSMGMTAQPMPQAPVATQPDPRQGYRDAFEAYIKSLSPTSEETEASDRLNKMVTQNRLDYEKALNQGETLDYSTGLAGEQARTAGIQEAGAAATLDALTKQRTGRADALRAGIDFEKSVLDMDAENAKIAAKNNIRSGALEYTPQDYSEDSIELENSRGSDGWVDPTVYQNLFKEWTAAGGLLEDFLKQFPPQNYVNPENTWLPEYLKNSPKLSLTSIGGNRVQIDPKTGKTVRVLGPSTAGSDDDDIDLTALATALATRNQ